MLRKIGSILLFGVIFGFASLAFAEGQVGGGLDPEVQKWVAIAAGFAIAIAAFGGALGQGKAVASALEGIARNPQASGKMFTPFIIGLALIESLCIYALVICFMMVFKIPGLDAVMKSLGG